ncbi:MAG TPA: ABC transporter substrate-binding protein [Streptosporangiaceae bacterium]|nr:ABC transporter substrate-binding protein [Streptosporangiaceae bacterium]
MVIWKGQLRSRARSGKSGRRARLSIVAATVLALIALAAGCSSSTSAAGGSSPGGSAASASGGPSISGPAAPGTDTGLTSTTIRIAAIDDVNTPVQPGLFQRNVNAVEAWATMVNAHGGLAGRKVVVDFCDAKLDPNATTNCVIKACQNDFAMVGTAANALNDFSDLDTCKNAAGQPVGIPNLAAFGFPPYSCDKVTYLISGIGSYCATAKDNPQTYTVNIGDFRYYQSHFSGLHGVWVYNDDVPAVRITSIPGFQAGVNLGIGKDGGGFYPASGAAPQSAMIPIIQVMKQSGSTLGYGGATPQNTILLRKEAQLQGLSNVKVWGCNSGCYDQSFLQQGGSAVNGEYALLNYLPFYTDYTSNPTLKALVSAVGGIANINGNALESYLDALLFQDAVNKAVAGGGTLNRQTLFAALNKETAFNADGIIGTTNVAARAPSPCIVITQVVNGQWQRVFPSKAGTFDCSSANLTTVKMNLNQ